MPDLPESIGRYKILEKLGEGGFATVYLAEAEDPDKPQKVALKVLNLRESYGRFLREIDTIARLEYPNIIRIFDTGQDERTGVPFFAMEYIPGGTLREKLDVETCLPRDEAIDIVRQIGAALTYAHRQKVIHRDVKPKNILLDTRQKPTRPVLTDFGLAKPLSPDEDLTMTVGLIGTFHYYAPEQWNKESLAPATDIYALAITFFEMLAGRRPFEGDIFGLRQQHLSAPLPRLSEMAAQEIGPFFDEVLMKAAAKKPADRYESVASFVEALEMANKQATRAERGTRQNGASDSAVVTRNKVQQDNHDSDEVRSMIGKLWRIIRATLRL